MSHYFGLNRHNIAQHELTQETLTSHPNSIGRILYFVLPYLFVIIVTIALLMRNLRVHQNNFIKQFPSNSYYFVVLIISIIGAGISGIYAVINDAWTVKQWLLFAIVCILIGLKDLIFTIDSNPTLIITSLLMILTSIVNQWLLIQLNDMLEGNQNQQAWKHAIRNFNGFIEAAQIIYTFIFLTQTLIHVFKFSHRAGDYFFWILAPLVTILVLVWNILQHGPILDLIGYIVASLLLFLGAAVSHLFHKGDQKGQSKI